MVLEVRFQRDEIVLPDPRPLVWDRDAVAEDFKLSAVRVRPREAEHAPGDQHLDRARARIIAVEPEDDLALGRVRLIIIGGENVRGGKIEVHLGGGFAQFWGQVESVLR